MVTLMFVRNKGTGWFHLLPASGTKITVDPLSHFKWKNKLIMW